jgi:phage/plasmid-like protein (TIGR03299 family)
MNMTLNLDPKAVTTARAIPSELNKWGLGFEYITEPVFFGEEKRAFANRKVIRRSDNMAPIEVVSNRYKPVQPAELYNLYSRLCENENFTMESMGAYHGGRQIYFQAKTRLAAEIVKSDPIECYLMGVTSCDGSLGTIFFVSSLRTACLNKLRMILANSQAELPWKVSFKHNGRIDFDGLHDHLVALPEQWDEYVMALRRLANEKAGMAELEAYYRVLFHEKRKQKNYEAIIRTLIEAALYSAGNENPAVAGTWWAALNGLTYYVDHMMRSHNEDNRHFSANIGDGANLKMAGLKLAMERVA